MEAVHAQAEELAKRVTTCFVYGMQCSAFMIFWISETSASSFASQILLVVGVP